MTVKTDTLYQTRVLRRQYNDNGCFSYYISTSNNAHIAIVLTEKNNDFLLHQFANTDAPIITCRLAKINQTGREVNTENLMQNQSSCIWQCILEFDDLLIENIQDIEHASEKSVDDKARQFVQQHKDFEKEGFSDYMNGLFNGYIEGYNQAITNKNLELNETN